MSIAVTKGLQEPQVPDPLVNISTIIEYNQTEDMLQLFMRFKAPLPLCQYPVQYYTVTISDITDNDNISITTTTITDYELLPRTDTVELHLLQLDNDDNDEGLIPDRIYTATVEAGNTFGLSNASEIIEFRTTDVHTVTVLFLSNGTLEVTCSFIKGTIARGCHVIMKTTPTADPFLEEDIPRPLANNIAKATYPVNGILHDSAHQLIILGYDLESDGSIGMISIQGELTIQYINTRPTPSSSTIEASSLVTYSFVKVPASTCICNTTNTFSGLSSSVSTGISVAITCSSCNSCHYCYYYCYYTVSISKKSQHTPSGL